MLKYSHMFLTLLRVTFGELFLDILYFPFWWYSFGAWKAFQGVVASIAGEFKQLNIGLWVKNIFTPMYGQYDWQGRMISFFMRVAQIIGRFIFFILWTAAAFLFFIIYLILPVAIIYYLLSLAVL